MSPRVKQASLSRALFGSMIALVGVLPPPARALADWEQVANEQGIEVTQREVAGRDLPTFRGVGMVEANPYEILAVLYDVKRYTQWMYRCTDARLLLRESDNVGYLYNRTNAPWPVADRDVVLRAETIVVNPGREIEARFKSVSNELMGEVRGIVRMPQMEGHYRLEALDSDRTRVEYQVNADPGGRLPAWIARLSTRDLPLRTLLNLRKQVARTRGGYEEFLDRWDAARR